MNVEIRDARFTAVVGDDVAFEQLGSGFDFTEGPVWQPATETLTFSDMPGNHMRSWNAGQGITTFRQPSNMANGNAYDGAGRLVTCEHATSRVSRTEHDGSITVLASHHGDKELNSPNDIIVKQDGAIYFSDPSYGRLEYFGVLREPELDFQGVYRIAPEDNALTLLVDDFAQPNGLCFSLDETRLFVNDTDRGHIREFDVAPDGSIANSRIWAETVGEGPGAPDGLKIDSAENLYCSGPGGVHVFAPDGTCLGVILTPEVTANFTWGDSDMCSLFLTSSTSLYRIRVKVPGNT
ncbi:MAG: SMP-30/gluconolactonase/LRE family protein [Rhodospirillaceae bacterium]|jgi:gluconolactonase|nr:SMP-30/gluconolactonase/LRE family protein [Rhodospirillaceae bacterium]MBT3494325.1 SMP-30/gluconolactonase/LRE family protein [Rhodospirillaceae bacterium]MBT3780411.1 SMP-30/gluconolactonase/LRE family protein [Rhodospirillaceae bacterium]MBT3979134.1 SMP-30/gluconolactonase/LRE family protein [Rhodospirillaceae bacterium]MBT4167761.1 SMP-30/gluconolactonase/LRE family protein [Rhodospirillaceae bacterium]